MVQEKPFNRYSYTLNHDTGEVETPDVFLLDKKLHKLGRLYPVIDLNIIVNVVDADEISFTFYKYFNDEEQELYSSLINYSVAFVQGFGCFELKVTETDNENGVAKAVSGQSLAYCELSQITATVEINTDDDIIREDKNDYIKDFPTVFYRPYDDESLLKDESYWSDYHGLTYTDKKKILKESSMLHRILSYAPHYRIGHVDKSLYFVQRQFSFDTDINSCLQEIAKEVGCIFTYNTFLDDGNQPVREINAYDTCYCTKCYQEAVERTGNFKTFTTGKYRSISNGICNTCGSSEFIYDYGDDSDIFLTTENLTDEIQVQPENEVKNCFKVSGGDDLITSTIQALQMSSSNRIVMFSDEQKEQMSEELRAAIEQYDTEYNDNQALFEDMVKTEYNVIDLIQYLQSGKMPLLAEDVKSIQEEVKYVLDSIISDYECNFYVSSYSGKIETNYVNHAYTSASNAIKNLCTLYIDKGYSVKVSNGDNMVTSKKDEETYIKWNGIITIYETDDRENNYANIHVLKDGETYTDPDGVTYTGTYVEYGAISKPNSNTNLIEKYYNFIVKLGFGDTDSKAFMSYIEQFCNAKLASYKDVEYKNREEKDWKLYSYERLRSYYDAYEECLNALVQIRDTSTENEKTIVSEMYDSYAGIQSNIEKQMLILRNQLNALYQFYGVYPNVDDSNAKDYIKKNYSYDLSALGITNVTDEAFIAILKDMADNGSKNYIGNKPFACQTCGSSNVAVAERKDGNGNVIGTYNYCKSCKETDQSKITTYGDVARQIVEFISQHGSRKYVNNYYLDNLGENVYGSYLSPSIPSYQFSLKDPSNNSGYVLSSYGQNVEPYIVLKTRRNTQSNKRNIVNHSSGTCYIIENNGDVLDVEVRYHSGGKLINSYTIPEGGITRIQTSNDNEMTDEYEVTIDIKQRHGGYINCTIFKCFDPRGDLVSYTSISDIVANNINYRGLYVWCSYETYNRIDVLFETNSIDSISTERNRLSEYFSLERYLGDDLYKELMLYIREDKYENPNYTSDGCLTNAQLVDKAQELLTKAKQELAKACRQQYSISSPVYSIVATKYRNWSDNNIHMKIYDEFESFKLGNWIRARLDNVNYHGHGKDNSRYKMRLMSIQFDFENIDKTNVTYSNVEQNTNDLISKIQDTIASASSMATTYDYVATQAEQGEVAKQKIDNILQNGFDSALAAIKAGENQDITMDRHGLLFRQYLPEKDDYSQYQMKMINRNIVMTNDYWKTASLAIGLGLLPDGTMGYGIWADNIIGGKINVTENLIIGNSSKSVEITSDGIVLDGGAITWKNPLADGSVPQAAVNGLPNTLQGLSKDIKQLDGRIQTYSQSDDPSTSWNEDEKSKHKGDIWFNPSDGLTKRWDGTKWDVVTDSNLVALAQSKGQIFTTQPTPPYNVGDLWIGNNESDLLRCQTPKKSGEKFDIKDWIVGVKYTDDSALDNWKDDFTSNIRPTIEKQIDEKADTWYSSTDPSLNWNNDDRKNHVGDLWYKTIPDSNGNYHTYIYNSSYKWEEVNGVPKEVFDMADGKASIYISKPTNGYKAKDLWILDVENADGNNIDYPKFAKGTLLTATTSSSAYNKSHWDEKVKYSNSLLTLHEELQGYVDDIFDDLQKQIDGEIVSWFYDYAPTLNNLPASEWKTKDEQIKHEGDLFYDTSTGIAYRFIYDDDTKTHKWIAITDAAITEALSLIATAQATADSKCKTFYSKPINGYDDGDIWILSSDETLVDIKYSKNTILTAILPTGVTSRTEFVAGDWAAVTTKSAEKALSDLSDISNDGKITPTEKQQIKMTVNDIKSTKISITKQCDAYGIVKENVVSYKTYLDSYNSLIIMTDSLLSNMSITSNTPSNYDSLFASYYTALENMTTIIEEASKQYASDVASGIKTDLQGQIDGKIETFYQDTVPTWNASENSKHIGDLWYNTSSTNIVHSGKTYSAKTNYRFNGTSWEENSIVPKDFYDAVDGKSTVYSSIPQNPQDRDLLIPGTDITVNSITYKKGKVYRYKSSDCTWNEINYTDDTALQEMLTSISADDKLSVTEKSYIKKQMDEIAKEYASIQARAEKYSIWNTLTSYQTAYTNLNNYISPLLSKMDEVSAITKSTFDNKFSDYYTELGVANGLIDTAIQSAAESTASKDLNAYKQEVDEFKELVDSNLSLVGVTKVASNYVYSPKIAGGYAYFTKDNYSVEIDPSHSAGNNTLDGYLFAIRDKSKSDSEQVIMGVDTNGNGYFSGEIKAKSGTIGGWNIGSYGDNNGWLVYEGNTTNCGIYYNMTTSTGYHYSSINNGTNFEMLKGSKLKFRINTYTDVTNNQNSNCLFANVGYVYLGSSGTLSLNSKNHMNFDSSSGGYFKVTTGNYYSYITSAQIRLNATNGVYVNDSLITTSDVRYKTDIETIEQKEVDFILGLTPKKYKLTDGSSGRYHYGFIAQEIQSLMKNTIGDAGLLVKHENTDRDSQDYIPIDFDNEETFRYGLRYEEFIAPMVKTIQYLNKEIEELKAELEHIKSKN